MTEALALGYLMIKQEDKRCMYSERLIRQRKGGSDLEYQVSLIADCHKQKYHMLIEKNQQAAINEIA